jgi:hypothetical protein
MNMDLLARVKQAVGNPTRAVSETSVDQFAATENAVTLSEVIVNWEQGMQLTRVEKRTSQVPCFGTFLSFNISAFKSAAHGAVGDLVLGHSVDVYGYDIATDAEGRPLIERIPVEGSDETQEAIVLITEDENKNPIEPKKLLGFKPYYGTDRNKDFTHRPKYMDMLALSGKFQVPEKPGQPRDGDNADVVRRSGQIDWNLIPGLQEILMKPMLNARINLVEAGINLEEALTMEPADDNPHRADILMYQFVESIPIAANAPSKQLEAQAGSGGKLVATTSNKMAASLPKDAFAEAPEATAEKATAEKAAAKKK